MKWTFLSYFQMQSLGSWWQFDSGSAELSRFSTVRQAVLGGLCIFVLILCYSSYDFRVVIIHMLSTVLWMLHWRGIVANLKNLPVHVVRWTFTVQCPALLLRTESTQKLLVMLKTERFRANKTNLHLLGHELVQISTFRFLFYIFFPFSPQVTDPQKSLYVFNVKLHGFVSNSSAFFFLLIKQSLKQSEDLILKQNIDLVPKISLFPC